VGGKTLFLIARSCFLTFVLLAFGWYLHSKDVSTHNTVDANLAEATANIVDVKATGLGGTYLVVNFQTDDERTVQAPLWYGWSGKHFATTDTITVDYDATNPVKVYAQERSVDANLSVYKRAVPALIALSAVMCVFFYRFDQWRRRRKGQRLLPA
jgi:hypothetical protein